MKRFKTVGHYTYLFCLIAFASYCKILTNEKWKLGEIIGFLFETRAVGGVGL